MTDQRPPRDPQPLTGLSRELSPPPALEERVVEALAVRQLLRRPPALRRWLPLAAALAGLAVGWLLRGAPTPGPPAAETGLYLLLLSHDPQNGPSVEERVHLYGDWARLLASRGQLQVAKKLTGSGVVVAAEPGSPPRPFEVDAAAPSGFYLVRAGSLDEAVELARQSPHVGLGGRITVRPIDPV